MKTGKSGNPFSSVYSVCSVVGRFHCNGLRTTECTEYTEMAVISETAKMTR